MADYKNKTLSELETARKDAQDALVAARNIRNEPNRSKAVYAAVKTVRDIENEVSKRRTHGFRN